MPFTLDQTNSCGRGNRMMQIEAVAGEHTTVSSRAMDTN
jgi:hypothetical protein